MITLKKISLPEVREGIAVAYKDDQDLFDKYHLQPCDHFWATMTTMQMVRETAKQYDISNYKVIYQKQPIGYVTVFDGFLYSFGLNKKFRKKEILIAWWNEIKKVLGKNFMTMLYLNNTRAIEWLMKCGMRIEKNDDKTVILVNDK